jgi:RNA polymerase sigma factor (sigma-70 family)
MAAAPRDELLGTCRDLLEGALAEARTVWGAFDLPVERFAARADVHLARRLERAGTARAPAAARDLLRRTARADLALAVACDEGAPGAWEALAGGLLPRLTGLARKRGRAEADSEALAADVLAELSMPVSWSGARTLLGTFDGTGSLFAWCAVILVRRLARAHEREKKHEAVAAAAQQERARSGPSDDPADLLRDAEDAGRFERTLRTAWAALTGRERLALAYRFLDGVPQTAIARVLGISEPHTSRLVTGAVAKLRAAVLAEVGGGGGGARLWAALADAVRRNLVSTSASSPLPGGSGSRPAETP